MDRADTQITTPPGRSGVSGLRVAAVVALFSALGGLAATAAGYGILQVSDGAIVALTEDAESHAAAGRLAEQALKEAEEEAVARRDASWSMKRKAATHRAAELALFASMRALGGASPRLDLPPSWRLGEGEHLGLVDLTNDRVITFESLEITSGATLSIALPVLAGALQSQPPADRDTPLVARDEDGVWAVGTPFAEGLYVVARVIVPPRQLGSPALRRARRVVGNLAATADPVRLPGAGLPIMLLATLLGALIAGLWAHRHLGRPLSETLEASRGFVHGMESARADPNHGGRDARDIARAVNQLVERADRLRSQGRSAREEDISAAVNAIEELGRGNLRSTTPDLGEMFRPLEQAINTARHDLLERVTGIHEVAATLVGTAGEVMPKACAIGEAAAAQRDALNQLKGAVADTTTNVTDDAVRLKEAIDRLSTFASVQRRTVQDVRASLSGVARRVSDLERGAARIEDMIASADVVEQALGILSRAKLPEDARVTSATVVGESRAAIAGIRRELGVLSEEMGAAATSLSALTASVPEPVAGLESSVKGALTDAAATLVRAVEITVGGLVALERSARMMAEAAAAMQAGAEGARDLGPKLSTALADSRIGASFEEELLERLARWQKEIAEARSSDLLSPDGQAMMRDVEQTSRTARAKIERLVEVTEQTIGILRG